MPGARLLEILMALIFMLGLAMVPACQSPQAYHHMDDPLDERGPGVFMNMIDATFDDRGFLVRVQFEENLSGFEGVIQEVEMDNDGDGEFELILVEYFKLEYGYMFRGWDQHGGNDVHRRMTVYPANVLGVDYYADLFAQLPQNKDGSRVTNIPLYFNMSYNLQHDTIGEVTDDAKELAIVWEILYDREDASLEVVLPDRE